MKVLIVDDDPVLRLIWRKVLAAEAGLQVVEVEDGLAAWNLLQQGEPPQLCVMDVHMPRMDGLELLERMRSHARLKRVKVIMCTAVNDRMQIAQADSLEVDGYLVKPLAPPKALEMVRNLLKKADPSAPVTAAPVVDMPSAVALLRVALKSAAENLAAVRTAWQAGDKKIAVAKAKALAESATKAGLSGLARRRRHPPDFAV